MISELVKSAGRSIVDGNFGYCPCCRRSTYFAVTGPWLRDQYRCIRCGSIPRQRHLQYILDRFFPNWREQTLHESSPSNEYLRRLNRYYSWSFFFEELPPGTQRRDGSRCENLEALTFADESFELFITQDVFEHVFEPERAAREILRCLKPGGCHVFTAPRHKELLRSRRRAERRDGGIEHHLPPEYHGSPIGDKRCLVTWDYGHDFESLLYTWCGYPTQTFLTRDRSLGIDAEFIEVFVTRKLT